MTSKICQLYYVQNLFRSKMGGASFTSFMVAVCIGGKGLRFLTLWLAMYSEEWKNGFCVKVLLDLVSSIKWGPKMAASRMPKRMEIFCPKDHSRTEWTFFIFSNTSTA